MALLTTIVCIRCHETKVVAHQARGVVPNICHDCVKEQEDGERTKWLNDRAAQPLEERIRFLEEWVYDHGVHHPTHFHFFDTAIG